MARGSQNRFSWPWRSYWSQDGWFFIFIAGWSVKLIFGFLDSMDYQSLDSASNHKRDFQVKLYDQTPNWHLINPELEFGTLFHYHQDAPTLNFPNWFSYRSNYLARHTSDCIQRSRSPRVIRVNHVWTILEKYICEGGIQINGHNTFALMDSLSLSGWRRKNSVEEKYFSKLPRQLYNLENGSGTVRAERIFLEQLT